MSPRRSPRRGKSSSTADPALHESSGPSTAASSRTPAKGPAGGSTAGARPRPSAAKIVVPAPAGMPEEMIKQWKALTWEAFEPEALKAELKAELEADVLPAPPEWAYRKRPEISYDAVQAAIEVDGAAVRRRATPVRKSFVRSETGEPAPLSKLVTIGGRGGAVAIRLYLALLWRCSSDPYDTDKPARAWATLLDLEDPETKGTRRIAGALKTLEGMNLIRIQREASRNVITLLDESGDGREYELPSTAYHHANRAGGPEAAKRHRYFKISSQWWIDGDLQDVSTPGLIMLLILMAEQASDSKQFEEGGIGKRIWFSTEKFAEWYAISAKSRSAGTKELEARGLLKIQREALPDVPGSTFARRRYRNIYRLINPPSEDTPDPGPVPAPGTITS